MINALIYSTFEVLYIERRFSALHHYSATLILLEKTLIYILNTILNTNIVHKTL